MKKGFTLIELLAVIVILAIIALIAVPIVINIINDAKEESGIRSIDLYMDAVEKAIIKQNFKTKYDPDECIIQENSKLKCSKDFEEYPEELEIDIKGEKATSGTIKFEKGKIIKIKYLTLGDNYYRYDDGKVYKTQKPPKEAGLYDDNYNMLASWDELISTYHLDIDKNYTYSTYAVNDSNSLSMYSVLNNNEILKEGTILILKDGLANIRSYMFFNCKNLKTIILPQTVNFISGDAFANCSNLEEINLPDSITYIGEAFSGCTSLESIKIPKNLNYIQQYTFSGCSNLKKVIIPNGITSIGNGAFYYCENLTNIVIPDSVTRIGQHAFAGCENLKNIIIPNSVNYIGQDAFWNCNNLNLVIFKNTNGWYLTDYYNTEHIDIDVTNPKINATNLVTKYGSKYWKRDE